MHQDTAEPTETEQHIQNKESMMSAVFMWSG